MKTIYKLIIFTAFLFSLGVTAAQAADLEKATLSNPREGRHYTVLQEVGKPRVPQGKVEVVEFFWYGCPHCYRLEPYMEAWEQSKPSYMVFKRVPVPYNSLWNLHARTFYTAQKLGVLDLTHAAFFDAIHKERKSLTSQGAVAKFFTKYGVSTSKFNDTYSSFGVEARMRLASKEADFYKVSGVPTIIINGKYKTSASQAGSEANLIRVIQVLGEKERSAGSSG